MKHHLLNIFRKLIFLILFLIILLPLFTISQPEGYKPVTDAMTVRKKIYEASSTINTINTLFIQEKHLSFMTEKIISKGIMLYQKPDKLKLEYTAPFSYILLMNGGRMTTYNGDKKSEYDLKSNKMFSEINNLIIGSVQGNLLDNPDFESTLFENAENLFTKLIPQNKELGKYIKNIGLLISKIDFSVRELTITEPSDDFTHIRFTNKVINEEIPPASFNWQ